MQSMHFADDSVDILNSRYALFFDNLDLFDFDSKKAVASSAVYYGEILNVIRENSYNCLSKRQYVSSFDILNA